MDKKEHYRQVFLSFKELCASDRQPCSFSKYCKEHDVDQNKIRQILKGEFQNIRTLPGYTCVNSRLYGTIYENFKNLCSEGRQPGSFWGYCRSFGVSWSEIHSYMQRKRLTVTGIPGYSGPKKPSGVRMAHSTEIPFENVIFEESGFLPAVDTNVITVNVDGHVAVRFPADTDVDIIAKFIRKMGKEGCHVES